MHKKRLSLNTVTSFLLQLTTLISGLVIPRFILYFYGSEVNGLVNSVKQFLSAVTFLEFGMGAVVQSALYKPLADKNTTEVSAIICSSKKFFRKIGGILCVYVLVLAGGFYFLIDRSFSWSYVAALILIMSISLFAQYLFGITDRLLLSADQHGYIAYISQIIALIASTAACVILIQFNVGIHLFQLSVSVIYLLRPILMHIYVKKHYAIDNHVKYEREPIKQKWNGVAQHIAAYVLDSTDIIVLTLLGTLKDVSIYSSYQLVVVGVKQVFVSLVYGYQALTGELWAKNEHEKLGKVLDSMDRFYHVLVTIIFGAAAFLIVPFIEIYTQKLSDASYIQPLFAALLLCAYGLYCYNLPCHSMILSAGHYKQTQWYFIIAAFVNLVSSVILVRLFGLPGVALGTLLAMIFQSSWMIWYNVVKLKVRRFDKILVRYLIDGICILVCSLLSSRIQISSLSWPGWILMGIKVTAIWAIVTVLFDVIHQRLLKWKNPDTA